jgi:Tol biopolymer transport system component
LVFPSRQAGDRLWRLYYAVDQEVGLPDQAWAADWLSQDTLIYAGILNNQAGLYLANLNGSNARPFTKNPTDTAPAVSNDGSRVAYTSQGETGNNWDVYVAPSAGAPVRRLTTHPARDGLPTWSPDDNYIAFASDREGGWGLWVIDAAGQGQPRRLISLANSLDLHPREATPAEKHDWTLHTLTWSP